MKQSTQARINLLLLLPQGQDADNGHNEGGTERSKEWNFCNDQKHLIACLVESQGVCEWWGSNGDPSCWDIHGQLQKLHGLLQIRPVHQKDVRIVANHITYLRLNVIAWSHRRIHLLGIKVVLEFHQTFANMFWIEHDGLWRCNHDRVPRNVELRCDANHCRHLGSNLQICSHHDLN